MPHMRELPNYVLITPAKNEADFIEVTLKSVVAQTARPVKWVIVNDGSTDETSDIVAKYAAAHPWIELVQLPERRERHFAGKALAVNVGRERARRLAIRGDRQPRCRCFFRARLFRISDEQICRKSQAGSGRNCLSKKENVSYNYEFVGIEHVSGMCQMFRRECFEEIGGYQAVKAGGIDLIAVLSARAKGWETRTFLEKKFVHHRSQGGALHRGLRERIYAGRKDYLIGNHPTWELFRSLYQMGHKPYVIGGLLVLTSYTWCSLLGVERTIPGDLMALRRSDQLKRLKVVLRRRFGATVSLN